jgi:hypothetical protein
MEPQVNEDMSLMLLAVADILGLDIEMDNP